MTNPFAFIVRAFRSMRRRAASANYQTAAVNRLTASWTTTTLSADSQARMDLVTVRARARELRDNNDYASKFLSMVKTNVLGESGIHFRSKAKDPDRVIAGKLVPGMPDVFANKTIEEQFYIWGRKKTCTVHGTMTWCAVQQIVLEAAATDGECIIRKVKTTNTAANPFGFWLQIYEADHLDDQRNEMAANGNEIRMGVEIDINHRPVAYYLLKRNPSDNYYFRRSRTEYERVPADEIIHLGVIRRSCQTRYMSWLATSGYRLNMVGKYEESEATAARAAASKMGFFTKTQGSGIPQYVGEKDSEGNKQMTVEAGVMEELPMGMDVKVVDWNHPSTAYRDFLKTALRGVSAGLHVSYNSLANDMESVNFASGKLGLMEEREVFKAIQAWFIESFCEEVFSAWLESAMQTGAVPLPIRKFDKFNSPVFRGRRWNYVNPSQDVDADIRQLNAGLTSISRILAERNIDRDELLDEIADDNEALASRGIALPELQSKTTVDANGFGNEMEIEDDDEDTGETGDDEPED